jgi:predicted metalloprotease with PDZ domain
MRKMNGWRWMACIPLLLGNLVGALAAQPADFWCPAKGVTYGISLKPAEHVVHVDAVTHQPAPEFQLPVWNALYQIRNFAANVKQVKAFEGIPEWMCDRCDTGDARAEKSDKTTWQISSSGDHPCVTFSYDILTNDPGPFGSSLDAQHGFFNWAEVLVYRPDQRSAPVSLRIVDAPAGWRMRDGGVFGGRGAGELTGATAQAESYDRLADSPAMMGKLYESNFTQDGAAYHVVVDSPDVDLASLQRMVRKIAGTAVEWMQDRPFDDYTFLFLAAHGSGGGGMEHAYSTVIDVGGEPLKQDVANAADYTAHEFFHVWNVKRIRPQSLEPVDYTREQYSRALWFSEGVTSTVADIVEMRSGLADEKHMLTHLASLIGGLQSRSARLTQSVEESSLDTWLEPYPNYRRADRSISYYGKGELLGFLIDLEMRRLSNGQRCLRDLFQYMNRHYAQQGKYFDDSEGVRLALEELTGSDFHGFFARYVAGVEEIPYDQFFNYVGVTVTHRQVEQVYAGLVVSRPAGKPLTVLRIEENSPASRLDLSPGDKILKVNGKEVAGDWSQYLQRRNPKSTLHLKVSSSGGEIRELDLPLGTRKIDEYELVDMPGISAAARMRRTAFLRGEAEAKQP